ncbi:MAG TPA: universal stress protein [Symbiobacteriaceae bacterium]|nr:universal stress protein [Symbiobacteriaceae bacterium]
MLKHLLVPLDGSRLAEAVLGAAASLAHQSGARLTLLHVLERNAPAQVHGERHLTDPTEAEAYLAGVANGLQRQGLTVACHSHDVAEAGVAQSITRHSAAMGVDLVVMATHGEGDAAQTLFGSIAQQVIGLGSVPVLIIHPDAAPAQCAFRRIVVPLDQSEEHEASLTVAADLARCLGASVHLLTVVPRRAELGGSGGALGRLLPTAMSAVLDAQVAEAGRRIEDLVSALEAQGLAADGRVERGETVAAIVADLNSQCCDLLVLGTHARRGWTAFWSGSVAPRVLAQWRRPTLLVRAAPRG